VLREIADAPYDTADVFGTTQLAARFQAIRALANLDRDDENTYRYEDGVFLIHPQYRTAKPAKYDIDAVSYKGQDFCRKFDPLNDFFKRRASYHFKA